MPATNQWYASWLSGQNLLPEVRDQADRLGFTTQDVLSAVTELQGVYDDSWFRQNFHANPMHPMAGYLASPSAPAGFLEAMELGIALQSRQQLWGTAVKWKTAELRSLQGFYPFEYELTTLTWLEKRVSSLVTEDKLNLSQPRKPDAKATLGEEVFYVELSFMYPWADTAKTLEPLLLAADPGESEKLGREIPTQLARKEFVRMAQKAILANVEKAPGDAPMVLMLRPPSVLIMHFLLSDRLLSDELIGDLFQICSKYIENGDQDKFCTISKLVIDIPAISAFGVSTLGSYREFPRELKCFRNPLFRSP